MGTCRRPISHGGSDWEPGTRLNISESDGLILVVSHDGEASRVSTQGHLRLPVPVRQWCGLDPGTRMLVVGDPEQQRLVIYPPIALDALVARTHSDVLGGGAA